MASFSDDRSVALWDVGGEARLHSLQGHSDYVRAGACSPAAADVLVSGGYDHAVRLWDARAASCSLSMDHGAPVEAVLVLPSGGLVVSAGGCRDWWRDWWSRQVGAGTIAGRRLFVLR